MRFGEKVRDLRKKNSLTQDELAKCLGVSKRTIIGWERDGRYPRNVKILEKMADILPIVQIPGQQFNLLGGQRFNGQVGYRLGQRFSAIVQILDFLVGMRERKVLFSSGFSCTIF